MRLSEAIRLGSMMKPQAHHAPTGRLLSSQVATCALAAASEAVGRQEIDIYSSWPWPWSLQAAVACPVAGDGCALDQAACMVAHLNDDHYWTREQIADWVSGLEDAQVAKDGEAQARDSVSTVNDAEILITVPK